MIIPVFGESRFGGLILPGAAGDAQARGAVATLVREFGDNYVTYHRFLATELDRSVLPDPARFPTIEGYLAAWARIHGIVRAEAFLRNCLQFRRDGRAINLPTDPSVPLVDASNRLVNFLAPSAARDAIVRRRYDAESSGVETSVLAAR